MRKIPTLFVKDFTDKRPVLTDQVNPSCQWVMDGEGEATRKYDGTCCMWNEVTWWARREVKPGKIAPAGFLLVDRDVITGRMFGWEPASQSSFSAYLVEALTGLTEPYPVGTYELIGPKVNGNPEHVTVHELICHGTAESVAVPTLTFDGIRRTLAALAQNGVEGIVWHHPDGRMAKIKHRDFGLVSSEAPRS